MRDEAIYEYACIDLDPTPATCWLAQFTDTPCDGRLEKAHIIRQQTIRREVWNKRPELRKELGGLNGAGLLIWDERAWRPACHKHHTELDQARTLRIPRSAIPVETEAFAEQYGLGWWLDRTYPREGEAAA